MKKTLQNIVTFTLVLLLIMFSGVGLRDSIDNFVHPPAEFIVTSASNLQRNDTPKPEVAENKAEIGEYISGPVAANLGELCVFKLNDPAIRADWTVIRQIDKEPPATFYIDSSGSALTFSSNIAAKYTIVAAIVEDFSKVPKILQHVCEYGIAPLPEPNPTPTPTPKPDPVPLTLADWVRQNIPETGKSQATILASCYESCAQGIEKEKIRTPEAAFSILRTNSQTKIKTEIWKEFLDKLSEKINEKLSDNRNVKALGVIFSEIATGLKSVSEVETKAESEVSAPVGKPECSDPTGKACQKTILQPKWRYR